MEVPEMDLGLLLRPPVTPAAVLAGQLADCNAALAPFGMALTAEQLQMLLARRADALQETQRVEFGHGILSALTEAFAGSPYLASEGLDATLAELQDIFYRLKEESEERVPDSDLLDALRFLFDNDAAGSLELLETLPLERLFAVVRRIGQDLDEDWSETDAYEAPAGEEGGQETHEALDRVKEKGVWDRPGNEYAATFYDGSREVYRITADKDGRIGGSSLG